MALQETFQFSKVFSVPDTTSTGVKLTYTCPLQGSGGATHSRSCELVQYGIQQSGTATLQLRITRRGGAAVVWDSVTTATSKLVLADIVLNPGDVLDINLSAGAAGTAELFFSLVESQP